MSIADPSQAAVAASRVVLPATADRAACDEIRRTMLTAAKTGSGIEIDGAAVQSMSTPCLQLLLSAQAQCKRHQQPFSLVNASVRMMDVVSLLGLSGEFDQVEAH